MPLHERVLRESVLLPPSIQKELGIFDPQRSLVISCDVAIRLESRDDSAHESFADSSCEGNLALRPGFMRMHEQETSYARTLGGKYVGGSSSLSKLVRPSLDDYPQSRRDEVRVAAQVEPGYARTSTRRLPCLPHIGDHDEGDSSPFHELRNPARLFEDQPGGRRTSNFQEENLTGCLDHEIRHPSALPEHSLTGHDLRGRQAQKVGEQVDSLGGDQLFKVRVHASLNRPACLTSKGHLFS